MAIYKPIFLLIQRKPTVQCDALKSSVALLRGEPNSVNTILYLFKKLDLSLKNHLNSFTYTIKRNIICVELSSFITIRTTYSNKEALIEVSVLKEK